MCWNLCFLPCKHSLISSTLSSIIHGHAHFPSNTLHNTMEFVWIIIWWWCDCLHYLLSARITFASATMFVVSSRWSPLEGWHIYSWAHHAYQLLDKYSRRVMGEKHTATTGVYTLEVPALKDHCWSPSEPSSWLVTSQILTYKSLKLK